MNEIFEKLTGFLQQSEKLAVQYGKQSEYENLSEVIKQAAKKELVLLVCGEFKRGKSSFVNALLGQDLCPVADGITTSTVSIIRFGEQEKAIRHYSVLETNKNNEECLSMKDDEISINQIGRFAKGTSEEIGNTLYIEIEVPNALLKNGLVLIDTPGVGSLDPRHLFLTLQALPKADAFFFVTDTGEPLTTTELDFIKNRLVPTEKPFDILLSKSDKVSRSDLSRYIEDTEKKVCEYCGKVTKCTPVSSIEWDSYNKTGYDRRKVNSNCVAVYSAIDNFRIRREQLFTERFREQFCVYLEGVKKQASSSLDAVKKDNAEEIENLKQQLNGLNAFKSVVTNENSEFRLKINSIIESSQEKVMQDFSRNSVLLSSEKLEEILSKPEAARNGGEEFVMREVNEAIKKLSENLDDQINCAMGEVMNELQQYIKSTKLERTSFNGIIQSQMEPLIHTFSENFISVTRSALPFIGVTTIASAVTGIPLYFGAGLLGLSLTPFAFVAGAVGLAAGAYYVAQAIKGTKKNEKLANIRRQISPRISIVMNELRLYIQKRYSALQKEVVNSLRTIVENMTQQMQDIVRLMQECQQNNQKKAQKTIEIENELKLIDTLMTQMKVYGTNPFVKK
jgi:predicted GTPase